MKILRVSGASVRSRGIARRGQERDAAPLRHRARQQWRGRHRSRPLTM